MDKDFLWAINGAAQSIDLRWSERFKLPDQQFRKKHSSIQIDKQVLEYVGYLKKKKPTVKGQNHCL